MPIILSIDHAEGREGILPVMTNIEAKALTQDAITLMTQALALLDRAEIWDAGAHLDLAIRRLERSSFDRECMSKNT